MLVSSPESVAGAVSAVGLVAPVLVLVVLVLVLVLALVESGAVVAGPGSLVPGGFVSDESLALDAAAPGGCSVHPPKPSRPVNKRTSTGR